MIYPYCLEARIHEEDSGVVPIGLYYIGALLKENGYDVDIFNWSRIHETPHLVSEYFRKVRPDIVGFSVLNANRWGAVEIAAIAKKLNPETKTVFGGVGATFLSDHFLKHFDTVDYVVAGEGEYPFLHLVQCIENGDFEALSEIKGLAFRKNGRIVQNTSPKPIPDIDELPNPARYFNYAHLILSRGCPGNCTFCGSPKIWGRKVRFHSPEYFVEQIRLLYQRGLRFFYFSDDMFTLQEHRVVSVCQLIIESNLQIDWAAISHVDYISENMLHWMRKAGCIQISYGVESGSSEIRRYYHKTFSDETVEKAFSMTQRYGIMPRAYFIYGAPGETAETIQETIELIERIQPLSVIFYILDIFPGTAIYDDYIQRTGFKEDIWLNKIEDILYFETDPEISREMILDYGGKLRDYFYRNVHRFAETVELIDDPSLYPLHSDFLSRLGMTFSHGDYAKIDKIPHKNEIAEKLYRRALSYYPHFRAYFGLGLILQQRKEFQASIAVLSEGKEYISDHKDVDLCIGINWMNLKEYRKALTVLSPYENTPEAKSYIDICRNNLDQ